jgi:hypothetical protein
MSRNSLISATDGNEFAVSLPGFFVLEENFPVPTEQKVKWTSEAGLGGVEKRKVPTFARNLNPSVISLTGRFTDSGLSTQIYR